MPDGVLSAGVAAVPPPEAGELDVGETGVEGLVLALADADPVADALAVAVAGGDAVPVWQGVPVELAALLLPLALGLAFAEAVVLAPLVALWVALALAVAVAVAVPVAVTLSLALALLLAGLLLGLPLLLGRLVAGAGVAFGVNDLAAADDEDPGEHVVVALLGRAEVRPGLAPPPDDPFWLPDPARLGTGPLLLEEEIPTAEPTAELSWTKASRSGGTARATPMANTAQAAARAGRSSPYRQSRDCRRA